MTIRLFSAPSPKIQGNAIGMDHQEQVRYRWAALHGRRMYPGPLGELVYRELTAYADFGYRFSEDGLIPRLAMAIHDAVQQPPDRFKVE